MNKMVNIIFLIGFFVISSILFLSSFKVVYKNIKYFNIIKEGTIIDMRRPNSLSTSPQSEPFLNTIIEDKSRDTLYGGSQNMLEKGDKVKFRYSGEKGGNVIFEVNNKVIGSKYDTWDKLSPFIIILFSYLFFRFIKYKILK